jgi:hypothetical protein
MSTDSKTQQSASMNASMSTDSKPKFSSASMSTSQGSGGVVIQLDKPSKQYQEKIFYFGDLKKDETQKLLDILS